MLGMNGRVLRKPHKGKKKKYIEINNQTERALAGEKDKVLAKNHSKRYAMRMVKRLERTRRETYWTVCDDQLRPLFSLARCIRNFNGNLNGNNGFRKLVQP